jgi:hypothetical protein
MERSTACPDWADRLRAGESIIPPPIFPAEAERALAVFKALRIVDAPGSPTFGEICEQWVFDLVASVFGAYDPESGRRLITEWFILLPKKNGKSHDRGRNHDDGADPELAPVGEVHDPGADGGDRRTTASTRPGHVQRGTRTELAALMHVQTHVKTITHRASGAP